MTTQTQRGIALITGANNGIGLELTRKLLGEGWEVIALIRSGFPEEDAPILEALSSKRVRIYKADLADFHSLGKALGEVVAAEPRIDLLFNNAAWQLCRIELFQAGAGAAL